MDARVVSDSMFRITPSLKLRVTPVFDTYWRFAAARQAIFAKRVAGEPSPWTEDPVLSAFRFTNAYRASDRVSQYLIRHVVYEGSQTSVEVVFRVLLFKFFNRIDTWETLKKSIGELTWSEFDATQYAKVLDSMMERGECVYSSAYIMPSPPFGKARKHANHLDLLEHMMRANIASRIEAARSLEQVFLVLKEFPSIGDFLAFQFAIDLNYSEVIDFSEGDFVVAGPGAQRGIRKCFIGTAGLSDSDVIRAVTEHAAEQFEQRGLDFKSLWGRALQLIDCQNLFCEVDKYARIAHPEFNDQSGRVRIKRRFTPQSAPATQWYPPKWGIARCAEVNEVAAKRHSLSQTLTSAVKFIPNGS